MSLALNGRTVALLEARQSDELAAMISRFGGVPICAPAVREHAVHDRSRELIQRIGDREFSIAVILTGAAVNALVAEATRFGVLNVVQEALGSMIIVCRGPKPQAALKRLGLSAAVVSEKPHTTLELVAALESLTLSGQSVMLLHYGERNETVATALAVRGARVDEFCLYEWRLPEDVEPVRDVIRRAITGEIDALLVTSQIQFRFLMEIAGAAGMQAELARALNEHVVVGAVGPVCASALRSGGVLPDVIPAAPNSASLVRALADYFDLTSVDGPHDESRHPF